MTQNKNPRSFCNFYDYLILVLLGLISRICVPHRTHANYRSKGLVELG